MTNTNKTNKHWNGVLNSLNSQDKEIILEIAKNPEVRFESDSGFVIENVLVLKNNKHTLRIHKFKGTLSSPLNHFLNLKDNVFSFFETKDETNHIKTDLINNVVCYKIGNDLESISNDELVWRVGYSFSVFYVFELDKRIILIANYNEDLEYFLKNNNHFTTNSILGTLFEDAFSLSKDLNDFIVQFKMTNEYEVANTKKFLNVYDDYYKHITKNSMDLLFLYFQFILKPQINQALQGSLNILAKSGLKIDFNIEDASVPDYEADYEDFDTDTIVSNFVLEYEGNIIFEKELNFKFTPVFLYPGLKGAYWTDELDELKSQVNVLMDEINRYLQPNIIVAYNKIVTTLNIYENNVSYKNIENNKIYLSDGLQLAYGRIKVYFRNNPTLNDNVMVWKYSNNVLKFDCFSIYDLCVKLAKAEIKEDFSNINLTNAINNSFEYMVIDLQTDGIYFNYDIRMNDSDLAFIGSKQIANLILFNGATKYKEYCNDIFNVPKENKYHLEFQIENYKNVVNLNDIINGICTENKDRIVLKETVQEKIHKTK